MNDERVRSIYLLIRKYFGFPSNFERNFKVLLLLEFSFIIKIYLHKIFSPLQQDCMLLGSRFFSEWELLCLSPPRRLVWVGGLHTPLRSLGHNIHYIGGPLRWRFLYYVSITNVTYNQIGIIYSTQSNCYQYINRKVRDAGWVRTSKVKSKSSIYIQWMKNFESFKFVQYLLKFCTKIWLWYNI